MTVSAFPATRTAALERLQTFVPKAGKDYAAKRNYDLPGHPHVSTLSPYLRHRILTEEEVLTATLGRFSLSTSEKFVQEVYWRTYWKGWLEMRPGVWSAYKSDLKAAQNRLHTESGLRSAWEAACTGETGIDAFDHWAEELTTTGYLHNHARMWFASIWMFTLHLPWTLGADFFLRHLLDGDPASNTLSWRWVGGLQTKGKTYLARTSNISKYTEGRFHPKWQLAGEAQPLAGPEHPARTPIPESGLWARASNPVLLMTEEDLSPGFLFAQGFAPKAARSLISVHHRSPFETAPRVAEFTHAAVEDAQTRYAGRTTWDTATADWQDIATWAQEHSADAVVTPYAPTGPTRDRFKLLRKALENAGISFIEVQRAFDQSAWPHATHGFFRFKDAIPNLVAELKGLRVA